MTHTDIINDLNEKRTSFNDREQELERLQKCYMYASADDRKVIWAVLNKYVPMLCAEGIL